MIEDTEKAVKDGRNSKLPEKKWIISIGEL